MPELPEAEIAGRQLHRWLSGHPVDRVELRDTGAIRTVLSSKPSLAAPGGQGLLDGLLASPPERPLRHGKRLGWPWGDRGLLVHLGMSGKFVQRPVGEEVASARIGWVRGDTVVWFVDRRRFGCVVAVDRADLEQGIRDGHGPDALDEAPDGPGLQARLTGRRGIKVALMDQAKLAGMGNIHAAEALFRAKVDPRTPCNKMTERQWAMLAEVMPLQLQEVIEAEDRGEIVYMTDGNRDNPFSVYGKEGEQCPVCSTPIESFSQSGRTTYFCPSCQG